MYVTVICLELKVVHAVRFLGKSVLTSQAALFSFLFLLAIFFFFFFFFRTGVLKIDYIL